MKQCSVPKKICFEICNPTFVQEFCECYRLRDEENFVRGLRTLIERRGPNQVRESLISLIVPTSVHLCI